MKNKKRGAPGSSKDIPSREYKMAIFSRCPVVVESPDNTMARSGIYPGLPYFWAHIADGVKHATAAMTAEIFDTLIKV